MWTVVGIITLAVQPGLLQVVGREEFENPQDCFEKAMMLMKDADDPRGMACVPIPPEWKTGA